MPPQYTLEIKATADYEQVGYKEMGITKIRFKNLKDVLEFCEKHEIDFTRQEWFK